MTTGGLGRVGTVIDELVTIFSFRSNIDGLLQAKAALWDYADATSQVGSKLAMTGIGATLANIGNLAMFAGLERNYARIEALVGIPREALEDVHGDVLRMSLDMGHAQATLAEGIFYATSGGLELADSLSVVERSAKAAKSDLGDIHTIVKLATSAMNAYSLENLTAESVLDSLTSAIRLGQLETDELAGVMSRVLPVAATLGVSFNELTGMMAAMSRTGTNADQAATQLRVIMGQLLKPSERARQTLAGVGLTFEGIVDLVNQEGLFAGLGTIWHALDGNQQRIAMVFDEMNALTGIFDLFGDQLPVVTELLEEQADATGSLDRAYEVFSDTIGFRFAKLWNAMEETTTGIGKAMRPMANMIMDLLTPAISTLARVTNSTNPILQMLMRTLGAIGFISLAGGAIMMLIGFLGKLGMMFMLWRWLLSPFLTFALKGDNKSQRQRMSRMRRTLGNERFDFIFGRKRNWKAFMGMMNLATVRMAAFGVTWPFIVLHMTKFAIRLGKLIVLLYKLSGAVLLVNSLRFAMKALSMSLSAARTALIVSGTFGFRQLTRASIGTYHWINSVILALSTGRFGKTIKLAGRGILWLGRALKSTRLAGFLGTGFLRVGAFGAAKVGAKGGWMALLAVMGSFLGKWLAIIAAAAAAGFVIDRYWAGLKRFISGLDAPFKIWFIVILPILWALTVLWKLLVLIWNVIWKAGEGVVWMVKMLWKVLGPIRWLIGALYDIWRIVYDLLLLIADVAFFYWVGFGDTEEVERPRGRGYARGGIVPGRSWQAVPATLHGGEAVLPAALTQSLMRAAINGGAPGGNSVMVRFEEGSIVVNDAQDARQIARGIVSEIEYEIRNVGYAFDSGIDT